MLLKDENVHHTLKQHTVICFIKKTLVKVNREI